MKLIIAGSRSVTDYSVVRIAIVNSGLWKRHKHGIEIVSGGAKGVDRLGEQFAKNNGLQIHQFIPDWSGPHKKAAGMLRNIEMGKFADALVAVWDGESRGTKQMIDWMTKAEKFVFVHITKGE